ncbi:MAG: hypothetical protein VZQ98_18765, partial [Bacteroidales bacterium]|nr:hypothetical protein [Bacteroidales bacterium]
FGSADAESKKSLKVNTQSGRSIQVNICDSCDSVWFYMPVEPVYISMEEYHSIIVDSTFYKCNFRIEPYWNVSYWKGLDSVGIGTKMCILPNYYSSNCDRPSSYPQRRILFKSLEGEMIEWYPLPVCSYDTIFFYMSDRDVKVSVEEINYHSIIMDSSFARCNVVVNPNRDLDSIADGLLLNFMSIFNGLGNESKLTIQTKDGDTLKSFKIGDDVKYYMPNEDIVLSVSNPVYEIAADSLHMESYVYYPKFAEAGTSVEFVYKGNIIPKILTKSNTLKYDVSQNDSTGIFVMPYDNVILSAKQMKDLTIQVDACSGGEIRCPQSANAGDTIIFNVVPDIGYGNNVVINNGQIKCHLYNDTTYWFVMEPDMDVRINACFYRASESVCLDPTCKNNLTIHNESNFYIKDIDNLVCYDSIQSGTRVILTGFGSADAESKKSLKVNTQSGRSIQVNICDSCDSVWFYMPVEPVYISME